MRLLPPIAHTLAFAVYPVAIIVGANAAIYPIDLAIVARALAAVIVVTVAALWLLGFLGWTLEARAAWLSVILLVWNWYDAVSSLLGFRPRVFGGATWFAVAYIIAAVALASVFIRPWRISVRRNPIPLTIAAGVLLALNMIPVIKAIVKPTARWEASVRQLSSPPAVVSSNAMKRDVYLIILDSFVRPDILRDRFGVDLSGFVTALDTAGFYVPDHSRSNYSQTFLAISSMLNMSYLDEIVTTMGEESRDRRPLKKLIEYNALMALAKRAGYTVVAIGSDYTATDSFPLADVCTCSYRDPHEIEFSALRLGPAADLGIDYWMIAARQRKVLDSLAAIERTRSMPGPKLVVAHIIAPHPPFVFDRHGRPLTPARGSVLIDGEWLPPAVRSQPRFKKAYAEGYGEQARFVADQVLRLVETLSTQADSPPAMMIVGDHGSAMELDSFDPKRTDLIERMSVFSAYRLPDSQGAALYPEISPLNGTRALARYFGADLPFLPERSLFSIWNSPYSFVTVASEERPAAASMGGD